MIEPELCGGESLCNIKTNWTLSESVRLVAAVIKSDPTRPNWENVSKLMSIQPEAKQRFIGFFSPKNCSLKFIQLVDSFLTHTTDAWINTNKAEQLLKILASEALLEKSRQLEKNCLRAQEQHSCGWNSTSSNALDLSLNTESIFEDAVQFSSPAESLTEDYFHFAAMNKSSNLVLAGPAAVAKKSLPKNLMGEEDLDVSIRHFNFDELVDIGSNNSLDDDDVPYAERLQKRFPIKSKPKVDLGPTSVKEKRKEQVPRVCLAFSQPDPRSKDRNKLKITTLAELQRMESKKSKMIYAKQSSDDLFKKPFPPKKRYKKESAISKTACSVTKEELTRVDMFQAETTNKKLKERLVDNENCTEEQENPQTIKALEETAVEHAVEHANYAEMDELHEDDKDEEEGCKRVLRSQRTATVPDQELPDRGSISADNNIYPNKTNIVKDELMFLFGQAIAFTPSEFYHCSRIGFPEGISEAIKRPMDLMTIKKLLEEEHIKTIPSLDGNLSRTYYNGFMAHPDNHPLAQKAIHSMQELLTLFREYRSNYLEGLGQEFQIFLETLGPINEEMVEESLCEMFGKERANLLLTVPLRQSPPTLLHLPRRSRELSPDITDLPARKSKTRR